MSAPKPATTETLSSPKAASVPTHVAYELLWIAGAGVFAWFFPRTTLVIVGISAVITIALRLVERRWT